MKLLIEQRPRSKKPWVVLMPTSTKPLVVLRADTEELARAVVKKAGHEVAE